MNRLSVVVSLCVGFTLAWTHTGEAQEHQTGSIRGKVSILAGINPDMSSRGMQSHSYGMAPMTHAPEPTANEYVNMVVSLEGKNLKYEKPPSTVKALLDQRNAEFVPHVLPIQRGTIVEFVNRDKTYHNVFSLSPAKRFNIGRRPTGEDVPLLFDKEGIVHVFCDIHSHMSAYILVFNSSFYVQPDPHGNYMLENIPAGTYTLKIWHERFTQQERIVTIVPGARIIENFDME